MFTGEIQRSRSKAPLITGLLVLVVILLIVLLVPMPHAISTTFTLEPESSTPLAAPRAGTIAEVLITDGATIGKGTPIAKYDVAAAEAELATARDRLALADRKLTPAMTTALKKSDAALKAATAALKKAPRAKKDAAQKKVDAAQAAYEKAQAAIPPQPEELETLKARIAELEKQVAEGTITAPAEGKLTLSGLTRGAAVEANAKLGKIENVSRLTAVLPVPAGETVEKGLRAELELSTGKRKVPLEGPAEDGKVTALVDNEKNELAAGATGKASIEGKQRSLLGALF